MPTDRSTDLSTVEWGLYGMACALQRRQRITYAQARERALDHFANTCRRMFPHLTWDDRRALLDSRLTALELDQELVGV